MRRGTTPTHRFTLPISTTGITKLLVTYSQHDTILVEKTLDDATLDGNKVSVNLTEAETLKFVEDSDGVDIQLTVGIGTQRMVSNVINIQVGKKIKEGILT